MTRPREQDAAQSAAWSFASQAAALFAIDPRLGGVSLHAAAGPLRDAWMDLLRAFAGARLRNRSIQASRTGPAAA